MKVALISEWLDPWRGGAETSTVQFIHHLMDAGVDLHVVTRSRPASAPGLEVHSLPVNTISRMRASISFLRRAEAFVHDQHFDVVHAISPCAAADIYQPRGGTVAETVQRNIALRRSTATRLLKRHANHLNLKQRYLLKLERRIMSRDQRPVIVALSDYVVRQLHAHYQLPDTRIRKIFNAVTLTETTDAERAERRRAIREEFGIAASDLLVLSVAHNFRLKGVRHWMEALAILVRRGVTDVRTLVVGKGDGPGWQRLATQLGIDRQLIFTGPSERVPAFTAAADLLVHPTYYDPCSRVVMEALASGLPVVTTRWDGAAELISPGESGFVLEEPDRPEELANLVERLRDASLRRQVSRAASGTREVLSMSRHAAQMLELYREVGG